MARIPTRALYIHSLFSTLHKMIYVIFGRKTKYWEHDFILKDLFHQQDIQVIYADPTEFTDITYYQTNGFLESPIVLVFSSTTYVFKDIDAIAAAVKPRIIIHLSDEHGAKGEFVKLSTRTPLLLRQYNHDTYNFKTYSERHYIPLGYIKDMIPFGPGCTSSLDLIPKPPAERSYIWSFVGNPSKTNRPELLRRFQGAALGPCYVNNGIPASEMLTVYMNSIFVPNARGNSSLDCLRIYEAAMCGAIPVVVGKPAEILITFQYEMSPPWIIVATWDEATAACKALIADPAQLVVKQRAVLEWWARRVRDLRNRIMTVLKQSL